MVVVVVGATGLPLGIDVVFRGRRGTLLGVWEDEEGARGGIRLLWTFQVEAQGCVAGVSQEDGAESRQPPSTNIRAQLACATLRSPLYTDH
jgi:hypothetical protein